MLGQQWNQDGEQNESALLASSDKREECSELQPATWARYVQSRLEHFERSAVARSDPALGLKIAATFHG